MKKVYQKKKSSIQDADYKPESVSESADSDYDVYDDKGKKNKQPDKEYPRKCDHCDHVVPMRKVHYHHYLQVHADIIDRYPYRETNFMACSFCGVLKSYKKIAEHEMKHSGIKVKCIHCDKQFASHAIMMAHARCVHPKFKMVCDFCSKEFKTRLEITRHIRTHTGEKPFKCHICGAGFAHSGNRQIHIRSAHQNIKQVSKAKRNSEKNKENKKKEQRRKNVTKKKVCPKRIKNMRIVDSDSESDNEKLCVIQEKKNKKRIYIPKVKKIYLKKKSSIENADYEPESVGESADSYYDADDDKGKKNKKPDREYPRKCDHTHTGEEPFKCHICGAGFAHSSNRQIHIRSAHQNIKQVSKAQRNSEKNKENNKKEQRRKNVTNKKVYLKRSKNMKIVHSDSESNNDKLSVTQEKKNEKHIFPKVKKFYIKKKSSIEDADYKPESVSESADSDYDVYDDKGKKNKKPDREYPRKCDHCDHVVPMRKVHYHHYLQVHADIIDRYPYRETNFMACSFCGVLKSYKKIAEHEMKHSGIKVKCIHCDKQFASHAIMMAHARCVHPKFRMVCDFCSKEFKTRLEITRHIRTHTGEKPFKCHICGAGFAHSGNRQIHIRSAHQNIKQVSKAKRDSEKNKENKEKQQRRKNVTNKKVCLKRSKNVKIVHSDSESDNEKLSVIQEDIKQEN